MRRTGPTPAVRDAVYAREGFCCASCGSADGPFAIHHRRPRGMGGTRRPETNALSALLLVCDGCHAALESQRTWALHVGLLVRQSHDPATTPLLYRGRWVLLTDFGSVENVEAAS